MQTQQQHPRSYSFEFFPPKTDGRRREAARDAWNQLAQLKPRFFSVTYGAGGSTRERTLGTVLEIRQAGHAAAPHLSCIGSSSADIVATLDLYKSQRHPPHRRAARRPAFRDRELGRARATRTSSSRFIRSRQRRLVPDRGRLLSRVPSAGDAAPRDDLANFKRKVDAGADCRDHAVLLQRRRLLPLRRRLRGARASICRSCPASCRSPTSASWRASRTPAAPRSRAGSASSSQGYGDDAASIRSFGLDVVTDLCDRLLAQGAPGLHFYTMNQARASRPPSGTRSGSRPPRLGRGGERPAA